MSIRDLKDIPMINTTITIPQPDYTNEEREFYNKKISKELCEMQAKANGQKFKWISNDDGDHFIVEDNRSFLDKLFNW